MSRYVIVPKFAIAHDDLPLAGMSADHASRERRLRDLTDRAEGDTALSDAIRDSVGGSITGRGSRAGSRGGGAAPPQMVGPVTGAMIAEMQPDEAERLASERPEVHVLEDAPLNLITPLKLDGSAKKRLSAANRWHLRAVGLPVKRTKSTPTGKGVTVAVLDTGIDAAHRELHGRVVGGVAFDVDNQVVTDREPADTDGHGTHVAGLIAGKSVGVAPGAALIDGLMIPKRKGTFSAFVQAMEWAAQNPDVQIINVSAGLLGFQPGFDDVVRALLSAGVLPIAAVGNEGRNQTRSPGNYQPLLSVGATDAGGNVAAFSGSGRIQIDNQVYDVPDLVAPGKDVYSSVRGGGYEAWQGTSMAAPIVSGLAALVLERRPDLPVLDLIDLLLNAATPVPGDALRSGVGAARLPK
jgi:subtilisin family serine protease